MLQACNQINDDIHKKQHPTKSDQLSVQSVHLRVQGPCIITVIPTVDCSTCWLLQLAIQNMVYCLLALAVLWCQNIGKTLCKMDAARCPFCTMFQLCCEDSVPTAKHKYMYHSHKSKAKHLILRSKHKTQYLISVLKYRPKPSGSSSTNITARE